MDNNSFSCFDEQIGMIFEEACKKVFDIIKLPVQEECKNLREAAEEVGINKNYYIMSELFLFFICKIW